MKLFSFDDYVEMLSKCQGGCVECGAMEGGIKPGDSNRRCSSCWSYSVYGPQILMAAGKIEESEQFI